MREITLDMMVNEKLSEDDFDIRYFITQDSLPEGLDKRVIEKHIGQFHLIRRPVNVNTLLDDMDAYHKSHTTEECAKFFDDMWHNSENYEAFRTKMESMKYPSRSFDTLEDMQKYCDENNIKVDVKTLTIEKKGNK